MAAKCFWCEGGRTVRHAAFRQRYDRENKWAYGRAEKSTCYHGKNMEAVKKSHLTSLKLMRVIGEREGMPMRFESYLSEKA